MNNRLAPEFMSSADEIAHLKAQNTKLQKINDALIFRIEEGPGVIMPRIQRLKTRCI